MISSMSVRSSELLAHFFFFLYATLVILKKFWDFSDGFVDVIVLLFISVALAARPTRLSKGLKTLAKERLILALAIFSVYFSLLSLISHNTLTNIVIEYFSVFKWLVYFFLGYLFAYAYAIRSLTFPSVGDLTVFTSLVLVYSVFTYNWGGIGGIDRLFGFYDNSFESIFSLRSVFALYALVVFVYALNIIDQHKLTGIYLLACSALFIFMSGNRKILIAVALLALFLRIRGRYKGVIKLNKYVALAILVAFVVQLAIFDRSVSEYSRSDQPRILAYKTSIQIAKDYFPIGSGPATFASRGSMENYSPIYVKYGLADVWGFGEFDPVHFYNDTYWAQIVGQYGVIGVLLTAWILAELYKLVAKGRSDPRVSNRLLLMVILLMSLVTPALQRIEVAFFIFFTMGLQVQAGRMTARAEKWG